VIFKGDYMQTKTTQKPLSRFEFNDRMHLLKTKLRFITDAIVYWNVDAADINEDATFGFGLFMDEIIEEMDECVQQLKE
jgi:hypothetical protein